MRKTQNLANTNGKSLQDFFEALKDAVPSGKICHTLFPVAEQHKLCFPAAPFSLSACHKILEFAVLGRFGNGIFSYRHGVFFAHWNACSADQAFWPELSMITILSAIVSKLRRIH